MVPTRLPWMCVLVAGTFACSAGGSDPLWGTPGIGDPGTGSDTGTDSPVGSETTQNDAPGTSSSGADESTGSQDATTTAASSSSGTEGEAAEMVPIPAGSFMMGCLGPPAPHCWLDEEPFHEIELSAFLIDRLEVTVVEYAACVDAGACSVVPDFDGSNPDFPMSGVTWEQANAYCTYVGKALPTEAQWEKAARGNADDRRFPWGNGEPTCALANWAPCGEALQAVGSFPDGASPYGVLDMGGSVWEWVADWYGESYYSASPGTDPPGPATGTEHVFKGGSYRSDHFSRLGIARRFIGSQGGDFTDRRGIRCAMPD